MDAFDFPILINAFYLLAAVLIFLGLKRLGSPATAREGNRIAALGMLIAVVVTLLDREIVRFEIIIAGIVVGAAIGGVFARAIRMTAMPQLVALFNGFGGAGSAVVAAAEFVRLSDGGGEVPIDVSVTIMLGTLVGLVTFSGSIIAFGKLQEVIDGKRHHLPASEDRQRGGVPRHRGGDRVPRGGRRSHRLLRAGGALPDSGPPARDIPLAGRTCRW